MLHQILLIFAFVCFVVSIYPGASRFNLVAAGLACWVATLIF